MMRVRIVLEGKMYACAFERIEGEGVGRGWSMTVTVTAPRP
jgi:hypothetical protein